MHILALGHYICNGVRDQSCDGHCDRHCDRNVEWIKEMVELASWPLPLAWYMLFHAIGPEFPITPPFNNIFSLFYLLVEIGWKSGLSKLWENVIIIIIAEWSKWLSCEQAHTSSIPHPPKFFCLAFNPWYPQKIQNIEAAFLFFYLFFLQIY